MLPGQLIRRARLRSGLTQRELARRAGTSQGTISAYETGAKDPSGTTLVRLIAAAGSRLVLDEASPVKRPARSDLARVGSKLPEVLELAAALPVRHAPDLRLPRLPRRA